MRKKGAKGAPTSAQMRAAKKGSKKVTRRRRVKKKR